MLSAFALLAVAAFVTTIASATNYCPLWVPVLLLSVLELLRAFGH